MLTRGRRVYEMEGWSRWWWALREEGREGGREREESSGLRARFERGSLLPLAGKKKRMFSCERIVVGEHLWW